MREMCRSLCRRKGIVEQDWQDLEQIALIRLLESAPDYDPDRSWEAWAWTLTDRAIIQQGVYARRPKHTIHVLAPLADGSHPYDHVADSRDQYAGVDALWQISLIADELTDCERSALRSHYLGEHQKQASLRDGYGVKGYDNALGKARTKIRNFLEGEGATNP